MSIDNYSYVPAGDRMSENWIEWKAGDKGKSEAEAKAELDAKVAAILQADRRLRQTREAVAS